MSLIELLIASLIIGIAVVGLSLMFAQGVAMTAMQGDGRVASSLAQQRIEELRAIALICFTCALATVPGQPAVPGCPARPAFSEQIFGDAASSLLVYHPPQPPPAGQPQYTRTTVVQCADPAAFAPTDCPTAALRVTVTVTPQSTQAQTVTIESVLTSH